MARPRRPNLLVLFSDQHQARALGAEGHPDLRTPHLDALAAGGTRFTRAYCQDGICVASRCSLFSGLYPRTLGLRTNENGPPIIDEVESLPRALQRAGYFTAAFGKRHLKGACDRGWDLPLEYFSLPGEGESYVQWIERRGLRDALDRDWAAEWGQSMDGERELPFALFSVRASNLPEDATMEAWTKQRTVELIRERAGQDQPFFCFASFYRPHQPYTPLPRYYARFDRSHWGDGRLVGDGLAMPASLRQPVATLPPVLQHQCQGHNRIWRMDLARRDEQIFRDYLAAYFALTEEIDDHVGDILAALDETGQRENTLIVYTSDHGDFVGEHGMGEKCAPGHNVYEATLRIPSIFAGPGVRSGVESDDLVELLDLYPTLLDFAEAPAGEGPHPPQGRSLAGALTGGERLRREFLVSENWIQSTVIGRRHKLGVWQEPAPASQAKFDSREFGDMLFDRENDPWETNNLAGRPELAETEARLRAQLASWQAATPTTAPRE
ncbi:MAG: sulfatase-like hydrolase/transferase [Verrucomicrobiota bacterium]